MREGRFPHSRRQTAALLGVATLLSPNCGWFTSAEPIVEGDGQATTQEDGTTYEGRSKIRGGPRPPSDMQGDTPTIRKTTMEDQMIEGGTLLDMPNLLHRSLSTEDITDVLALGMARGSGTARTLPFLHWEQILMISFVPSFKRTPSTGWICSSWERRDTKSFLAFTASSRAIGDYAGANRPRQKRKNPASPNSAVEAAAAAAAAAAPSREP